MTLTAFIEVEELWIVHATTGRVVWRGQPLGYSVQMVLPTPSSDAFLVLLRYDRGPTTAFRNLLRLQPDGAVVWQAELPDRGYDAYTDVEWRNHVLTAFSWSGFLVVLDPDSGRILSTRFTK